ncbi:MAG TPA: hypothetical protein VFJ19_03315 [Nocardioidaceae bacterium]|nr:hypothetical protein [Nocardioidaceae bacterium]
MAMVVLLSSPFLGPTAWRPVATHSARHHQVLVPETAAPASPHELIETFLATIPDASEVVLVPHSNAGLYVAVLATAAECGRHRVRRCCLP